jgi:hypothetical protein
MGIHFVLIAFVFLPMLAVRLDTPTKLTWVQVFSPVFISCTTARALCSPFSLPLVCMARVEQGLRRFATQYPNEMPPHRLKECGGIVSTNTGFR